MNDARERGLNYRRSTLWFSIEQLIDANIKTDDIKKTRNHNERENVFRRTRKGEEKIADKESKDFPFQLKCLIRGLKMKIIHIREAHT